MTPHRRSRLALGLLMLIAASPGRAAPPSPAEEWVPFEANWSASGHEHTLALGGGEAMTFELAGPFVVTRGDGLSRGFYAQAIGFVDRGRLGIGRLVLTDEHGDEVFNDLRGQAIGNGKQIAGTITGGTGRYAGLEGDFIFDWQYVVQTDDGMIQGRTVGLKGRYRRRPDSSPRATPGPTE